MSKTDDLISHRQKQVLLAALDVALFGCALWLAHALRLADFTPVFRGNYWWMLGAVAGTRIPIFVRLGLYRAVLRYPSQKLTLTVLQGLALSTLAVGAILFLLRLPGVPRSVLFIEPFISGILVIASRETLARAIHSRANGGLREPVLIYGAGVAGIQLAQSLRFGGHLHPVAFIDDEPSKWGMRVVDLDVCPPDHLDRLVQRHGLRSALLAAPATDVDHRRKMLERLESAGLRVKEVPNILDLVRGRHRLEELEEVKSTDLLGRGAVLPDAALLEQVVLGRSVLVTGAGGSIGSELCRQVAALQPQQLVLYEISEYALYQVEMELADRFPDLEVAAVLGSVLDETRLEQTYRRFQVDSVYHAAAYKHVPLVEQNPVEGVRNNVFGTFRAARAAARSGVQTFVLVSTDKAVRPCSVMGASKRLAELSCLMVDQQARASEFQRRREGDPTKFAIVRFGNVLDSAGSVVPRFREQIARGGPLTVTHPEVQRYFMTIPEAAQLVVQASAIARGGEVFLLDMGEPVKVLDLARRMVELATRNTGREIAIEFTGLRPGEKLVEELLADPERCEATPHPKIMQAVEEGPGPLDVARVLRELEDALKEGALGSMYELLEELVDGYAAPREDQDVLQRGQNCFSFDGNGHGGSAAPEAAPGRVVPGPSPAAAPASGHERAAGN